MKDKLKTLINDVKADIKKSKRLQTSFEGDNSISSLIMAFGYQARGRALKDVLAALNQLTKSK